MMLLHSCCVSLDFTSVYAHVDYAIRTLSPLFGILNESNGGDSLTFLPCIFERRPRYRAMIFQTSFRDFKSISELFLGEITACDQEDSGVCGE